MLCLKGQELSRKLNRKAKPAISEIDSVHSTTIFSSVRKNVFWV